MFAIVCEKMHKIAKHSGHKWFPYKIKHQLQKQRGGEVASELMELLFKEDSKDVMWNSRF